MTLAVFNESSQTKRERKNRIEYLTRNRTIIGNVYITHTASLFEIIQFVDFIIPLIASPLDGNAQLITEGLTVSF